MSDRHDAGDDGDFAQCVIDWQRRSGRHDLPWQGTRDPYRIWLSEIMLQQTQVTTVVPYFQRFVARFADVAALAAAAEDEVLSLWSGLGYYARARSLHRAARIIVNDHAGKFPEHFEALLALPGIGASTAGAISVFAFGQARPILDGNVKRVLARRFGVAGFPGTAAVSKTLWDLSARLLPSQDVEAYTQGLMDLGAGVCTRSRPQCTRCPLAARCEARATDRIAQLPGPRPRRVLPRRRTTMLVFLHDGAVLLEKRPGTGVWGGLWSFPEIAEYELAASESLARFDIAIDSAETQRMATVSHGFTHFHLSIEPLLCTVRRRAPMVQAPGRAWMPLADAMTGAIPAPVRTILRRLGSVGAQQFGEP